MMDWPKMAWSENEDEDDDAGAWREEEEDDYAMAWSEDDDEDTMAPPEQSPLRTRLARYFRHLAHQRKAQAAIHALHHASTSGLGSPNPSGVDRLSVQGQTGPPEDPGAWFQNRRIEFWDVDYYPLCANLCLDFAVNCKADINYIKVLGNEQALLEANAKMDEIQELMHNLVTPPFVIDLPPDRSNYHMLNFNISRYRYPRTR